MAKKYKIENNKKQIEQVMSEFVFDAQLNIWIIAKTARICPRFQLRKLPNGLKNL
jgi:hypothetical protein